MKPLRDYDTDPLTESEAAMLEEIDELREEVERYRISAAAACATAMGLLIFASLLI